MYWLAWCTSDCAYRKGLGRFLDVTVVAFTSSSLDDLDLSFEPCCTAFDQGDVGRETHLIYMSPCFKVVQSVEHDIETFEPIDVELRIFDIGMVRFDLYIRIEPSCGFSCDLFAWAVRLRGQDLGGGLTY